MKTKGFAKELQAAEKVTHDTRDPVRNNVLYGQPSSNSQTRFESMEACENARIKLMTDADSARRKAQAAEVIGTLSNSAQFTKAPSPPPMVSAVCKEEQ